MPQPPQQHRELRVLLSEASAITGIEHHPEQPPVFIPDQFIKLAAPSLQTLSSSTSPRIARLAQAIPRSRLGRAGRHTFCDGGKTLLVSLLAPPPALAGDALLSWCVLLIFVTHKRCEASGVPAAVTRDKDELK